MSEIWWDKDNPLHREIMDANKEAFIARHAAEIEAQLDDIRRRLPWPLRLYLKVLEWFERP